MPSPSDTAPAVITLYQMVEGATWPGIPTIGPVVFSEPGDASPLPPPCGLVAAELRFFPLGGTEAAIVLGSGPGAAAPITIVGDGSTWELAIPPVAPGVWSLAAGKYAGHLELTDSDGTVRKPFMVRQEVLPTSPPL